MWQLWLRDKLSMSEVDGPVWPPNGRSIDDVLDMADTYSEWLLAEERLNKRE